MDTRLRQLRRSLLVGAALIAATSGQSAAQQMGAWSTLKPWPAPATGIVAVHAAVLPTSKVLFWEGSPGEVTTTSYEWDPVADTVQASANTAPSELECSGHASLADGRLLVISGFVNGQANSPETTLYDATTRTWTRVHDLSGPRWYPTATALRDGRVLAISGADDSGEADIPEIYDVAADTWTLLPASAQQLLGLYPFIFVLPNGKLFAAGAPHSQGTNTDYMTRTLDLATNTWTNVGVSATNNGCSVMYVPGKVMKCGDGGHLIFGDPPPASAATEVIDMTAPTPAWRSVAPMAYARVHHNLVLLADGTALAVGGTRLSDAAQYGVLPAELWNPTTETWATMASLDANAPRMYHSTAVLLPDGRVLATGGGNLTGILQDYPNYQVFSPPYLFQGARPSIAAAPAQVTWGQTFDIGSPDGPSIASATLLRPGAVTHAFDQNQRFIRLDPPTQICGGVRVTAPATRNIAPPGAYMLFVINTAGVPSVAKFITIDGPPGSG